MDLKADNQNTADLAEALENEAKTEVLATIDFKMVTFSLAGKDYGVDIMNVKEIAKAGRFTYVPNTSPFVLGVYNLRGDIIPIIDLRLFFNIPIAERPADELENMIIVTVAEQTFGVVVDAIDKVVGISSASVQPPHPLFGDINIKYIYGVIESNRRLYVLLDIERIFNNNKNASHGEDDSAKAEQFPRADVPAAALVQPAQRPAPAPAVQQAAPAPQEAAPEPAPVTDDLDISFIAGSLQTLKKFTVSDINEGWLSSRFKEWKKLRDAESLQLAGERDADMFLETFYSVSTGTFWTKEYAEAVYKTLPDNSAKQIYIWNPGSGKGYEAFSLACLFRKRYPDSRIKIYAHDTDLLAISNAPMLPIPAEAAQDWYAPYLIQTVSGSYTFNQDIKEMVMFEYHNCLNANTMPNTDMIFCRDLLSFMTKENQVQMFAEFKDKLKGNGILMIGNNEIAPGWNERKFGNLAVYSKE
jgi:purine-binding chemotaxis protein CheW